MEQITQG
jgi:hypothetical protein